jgi:hypothetical protein
MLGGVVNEPLIYDVREAAYPLSEPASDVRGITGTASEEHYTFLPNIDWRFEEADNAIIWLERGQPPDDESVFYVDYFREEGSPSPLTDINVGSVTRTLTEAISRELAGLYHQVNLAYQSGFIDLAKGQALDFVVAILGVQRKTGDYAEGLVTFFRTPTSQGNITIPQGTKVTTADGVVFETISQRTMQRGQVRIDVPIRAGEEFKGSDGRVDAKTITNFIIPIEGIGELTNFDPTVLGADDETDEELRARAKAVLRALGQCTVDALIVAAIEAGAKNVEVLDPHFPPDSEEDHQAPGKVVMVVEVEPERYLNVTSAVGAKRAAGISVQFVARYVYIQPRLSIQLRRNLTAAGKEQLTNDVIKALAGFMAGLGSGTAVPGKGESEDAPGLLDIVLGVEDVQDARIADLLVWETVVEDGAQLGQRRAARTLIVGPDGATQATDAQIEAGQFNINIDSEWWPVLEMEPADIQLTEP